mgnify:CR=1 FL=1
MDMGAQHCGTFAMFGEPLAETAERIDAFRRMTKPFGLTPRFNVSFRPILAETEGKAWDKAKKVLDDLCRKVRRKVYFSEAGGYVDTPVYARSALVAGHRHPQRSSFKIPVHHVCIISHRE